MVNTLNAKLIRLNYIAIANPKCLAYRSIHNGRPLIFILLVSAIKEIIEDVVSSYEYVILPHRPQRIFFSCNCTK